MHMDIEIMAAQINMTLAKSRFLLDIMEKEKKHLILVKNQKMMPFIKICL